jgi:orotidine-5'-phosphate decarboxylase
MTNLTKRLTREAEVVFSRDMSIEAVVAHTVQEVEKTILKEIRGAECISEAHPDTFDVERRLKQEIKQFIDTKLQDIGHVKEDNVKSTYENGYKDGMEGQKSQAEEMMREVLDAIQDESNRGTMFGNKFEDIAYRTKTIAQKYGIDLNSDKK